MRIDYLELVNFKKYSHLKAEFGPGVNLLVGVNGAGKTSILEGLCVAVSPFFKSRPQKEQRHIKDSEIKIEAGRRLKETIVQAGTQANTWSRLRDRDGRTRRINTEYLENYGERVFASFDQPIGDILPIWEDEGAAVPLIVYYPTQRLFIDASNSKLTKFDPARGQFNGYLEALTEKSIKQVLNSWWGDAVTSRVNKHILEIEVVEDLVLANVERALTALLRQLDFSDTEFKVYKEPAFENELFVQLGSGAAIPLSYYSDGYRNLIYLVVDLVWRASQLNPTLTLEEIGEQVNGVVMIDEIDLHLHPKWQSEAIPILQKLLPQVQFFITTHSPTVVASYNHGQLYTLDGDEVIERALQYGKLIDEVQEQILQAPIRQPEVQEKIDRVLESIEQDQPEQAYSSTLKELTELLGADDADIQRAESMINWNRYEAKENDAVSEKG